MRPASPCGHETHVKMSGAAVENVMLRIMIFSGMHSGLWGPYKLLSAILSCCSEIFENWTNLLHLFLLIFFYFDFQGLFECGILPILTYYLVHFRQIDGWMSSIIPSPLCFLSVRLIFWTVYKHTTSV